MVRIFLLTMLMVALFFPQGKVAYALTATTRADISSGIDVGSAASDMDSASVESEEDLQAYARAALRNDENLLRVNFTGEAVEITYREKGTLLALMPVTFSIMARAGADGSIELFYPWYSFLTVDNRDQLETDMRVAVNNALRLRLVGSVQAEKTATTSTFFPVESALVASEMERILKKNFES